MSVGTKIKSLFWAAEPAAAEQRPTHAPTPAAVAATSEPLPVLATSDAKADQLLAAFEAMKAAMPGPQLQIAIAATANAIGAELPAVVVALEQRLTSLDAEAASEQRQALEHKTKRAQSLQTATAKVHADIKTMEDRITSLRKELASVTAEVEALNAKDDQQRDALERRTRAQAGRLTALRDFIAHCGARQ